MWAPCAWWNGLGRQKRTGWLIIAMSVVYIAYFLKARLLVPGDAIKNKEWLWLVCSLVGIMLGTVNIRMAEMRERNQQFLPLGDQQQQDKK